MITVQRWELSAFGRENLSLVSVPPLIDIVAERDVASNLDPEAASEFLIANIAGIRIAGRGGANARL